MKYKHIYGGKDDCDDFLVFEEITTAEKVIFQWYKESDHIEILFTNKDGVKCYEGSTEITIEINGDIECLSIHKTYYINYYIEPNTENFQETIDKVEKLLLLK